MDQLALMHNKSSSGVQYGQPNKGITVRDPSSMFMFGDTKLFSGVSDQLVFSQAQNQLMGGNSSSQYSGFQGQAFKSAGLLTENKSLQVGTFGKSFIGDPINGSSNEDMDTLDPLEQKILFKTKDETSGSIFESMDKSVDFPSLESGSWSALMQSAVAEASSSDGGVNEKWSGLSFQKPHVPKAEINDASTPSHNNNSHSPYFGLRLTPTSQRLVVDFSDPYQISNKAASTHNQHLNQNYITKQSRLATLSFGGNGQLTSNSAVSRETSHLVSVKKEDGEQWSTQSPNRCMDVLAQHNPSAMCEPPCTSYAPNSRKGTASGSLSGNIEADGRLLKQADPPHHNVSSVKAAIKIEREHYENKIPQITSPYNLNSAYGNDKSHPFDRFAKSLSQPLGNLKSSSSLVQVGSIAQYGSVPVTGTNTTALTPASSLYLQHLDVPNQNMAKAKKRKYPTYERLSWHKQVTKGCSWLHDMSSAELEWAHAVGRLPEKSEEWAREIADPHSMVRRRKRRLNITTQLMQLLFRAPAGILLEDATSHCDFVPYYAARLALGDTCNLCSTSGRKNLTSEWSSDQDLSKTVEGLIDKSKRLQDELSRMEEGESTILEVQVDFQDLEKFSVINRFAKFNARGALVTSGKESSGVSSSKPKLNPQRYVKASPMPDTIPEGQTCLSL